MQSVQLPAGLKYKKDIYWAKITWKLSNQSFVSELCLFISIPWSILAGVEIRFLDNVKIGQILFNLVLVYAKCQSWAAFKYFL